MIRINLLPFREEQKKKGALNQVIVYAVMMIVVTGGLFWYHLHLQGTIDNLNNKIEVTKNEVIRYNRIAKKVEELKAKLKILNEKLAVIGSLEQNRNEAFLLVESMTRIVVENRMWITNMEARTIVKKAPKKKAKKGEKEKKEKAKPPQIFVNVKIDGIALENTTVAGFMSNLQSALGPDKDKLFSSVKLIHSEKEEFEGAKGKIDLMKFKFECNRNISKKRGDKDKKEKKGGKKKTRKN